MKEKKGSKISHETTRHQRQFLPADDDSTQNDMDSIADAYEKLFETALVRLCTIRVPGKGKLSMDEAMEAALDQYEAFLKWGQSGRPIEKIIGWFEGEMVFTVSPPAGFEELTFKLPPPADAVLQITTQIDEDQVVLCNIRLEDVGPEGLDHTELLPNGQQLSLKVTRGAAGTMAAVVNGAPVGSSDKLRVSVAVDEHRLKSEAPVSEVGVADVIEDDDPGTDTNKLRMNTFRGYWNQLLAPFQSPVASFAQTLLTLAILVILIAPRIQSAAPFNANAGVVRAPVVEQTGSVPIPIGGGTTQAPRTERSLRLPDNGTMVRISDKPNLDPNRNPSIGWHLATLVPALVLAIENSRVAAVENDPEQVKRAEAAAREILNQYAVLESLGTFATSPQVTVRLKAGTFDQGIEDQSLRSSFRQAFADSGRFRVLGYADKSPADVVIDLRYERRRSDSGFVFLYIFDSKGKHIWRDSAECQNSSNSNQSAMFTVAAKSFVGDLEKVMDLSNQSQKNGD